MRIRLLLPCLLAGATAFMMSTAPEAATARTQTPPRQPATRGGPVTFERLDTPGRQPDDGTGTVSGVVTDAVTKRPVGGALVRLTGDNLTGVARPAQITDPGGRFLFPNLRPFSGYLISVRHPGYAPGGFGRTTGETSSSAFALADGQWFAEAHVELSPVTGSAIAGTVLDERGTPVAGVPVRILKVVSVGTRTYNARAAVVETDDRGSYRAWGLESGRYLVHVPNIQITLRDGSVRPPVGPQRPMALDRMGDGLSAIVGHYPTGALPSSGISYPMAYHPASSTAEGAVAVDLGPRDTRAGVDVNLALAKTFRVSGTLSGPPAAIDNMPVWLVHRGDESSGAGGEVAQTLSNATGDFTFLNVPAGEYTLIASRVQIGFSAGGRGTTLYPERGLVFNRGMVGAALAHAPGVSFMPQGRGGVAGHGRMFLSVGDRDIAGVAVPVVTGITVSGDYLWDGQRGTPRRGSVPRVELEPVDADPALGYPASEFLMGEINEPAWFEIAGVLPGKYVLALDRGLGDAFLEGAEWRGRDLLAAPLDITGAEDIAGIVVRLGTKPATVSGTVRDSRNSLVPSASVLFFPVAPETWEHMGLSAARFAEAAVVNGSYSSGHLIPGEYLAVAVPRSDRSRRLDRRYLATIAADGIKVRVEKGTSQTRDLTMVSGR